jgi:signal transduction histidine kinase
MRHITFIEKLYVKVLRLFNLFVGSTTDDFDLARREFVLNVVLIGIITLSFVGLVYDIFDIITKTEIQNGINPEIIFGLFIFFLFLYRLSRMGKSRFVAEVLIIVLCCVPFYTIFKWGIDIPAVLLSYSLIIVISGILINSVFAFTITGIIALVNIAVNYLQVQNVIVADFTWKLKPEGLGDIITFNTILGIIALVSWLYNRQSEIAFRRAAQMEHALIKERDSLEDKVEERTREIKKIQLERLATLNHMAEIGRMTAGFFHDLVNPLNLALLNLDRLSKHSHIHKKQTLDENKILIDRAIKGTKHLEYFIKTARKQIQYQNISVLFCPDAEIKDVLAMLEFKSKSSQVALIYKSSTNQSIYGNPLRFNQIVSNLISNAIDAYFNTQAIYEKKVEINLNRKHNMLILSVTDYGEGISKKIITKIFEPFFTTKKDGHGIGIGLTICREIIKNEFKGTILVQSQFGLGTTFTVEIPIKSSRKS